MNSKLKYLEDNKTEYDFLRSMYFTRLECYRLIRNINKLKKDLFDWEKWQKETPAKRIKNALKCETKSFEKLSRIEVFKNNERIL